MTVVQFASRSRCGTSNCSKAISRIRKGQDAKTGQDFHYPASREVQEANAVTSLRLDCSTLCRQPHLDQGLIQHVALVGGDLDLLQLAERQTH
jgi:hypothetical protein